VRLRLGPFILPARRASGSVWCRPFTPTRKEAEIRRFLRKKATISRRTMTFSHQARDRRLHRPRLEVRRRIDHRACGSEEIDVTSFAEVVLGARSKTSRIRPFGERLSNEYLPETAALLGHRRPRDASQTGRVVSTSQRSEGSHEAPSQWEADRAKVILARTQRDRNPDRARRPRALW